MSKEYKRLHTEKFPLNTFFERVYQMYDRCEAELPEEEEFLHVLKCMVMHKMVFCRFMELRGNSKRVFKFRHERVSDFFVLEIFSGYENVRCEKHLLNDQWFRGVYFLLATKMPEKRAERLLNIMMFKNDAFTKDHTVGDKFFQLLRSKQDA